MARTGTMVTLNPPRVETHPVFGKLVGTRWKIVRIVDRKGRKFADVGCGTLLPFSVLVSVPQGKGKTAIGKPLC